MEMPYLDPVALQLGPLAIRWYALAYIAGFFLGLLYIKYLWHKQPSLLTKPAYDSLLTYAVFGVILGGRLGYVLFYNLPYYQQHPLEILAVWHGGMSFHGGLFGAAIGLFFLARKHNIHYLRLMDAIAATAPIGLFFGRMANFINAELYGRVTQHPFGIIFPGDTATRHPSQLYEAALEGLLLYVLLYILYRIPSIRQRSGCITGVFLCGYATIRFAIEYVREPDAQLGLLAGGFTMGQILCVPMAAIGLYLVVKNNANTNT